MILKFIRTIFRKLAYFIGTLGWIRGEFSNFIQMHMPLLALNWLLLALSNNGKLMSILILNKYYLIKIADGNISIKAASKLLVLWQIIVFSLHNGFGLLMQELLKFGFISMRVRGREMEGRKEGGERDRRRERERENWKTLLRTCYLCWVQWKG